MGTGRGVCGILVTYNPEIDVLKAVLAAATAQLDALILTDNGSASDKVGAIRSLVDEIRQRAGSPPVVDRFSSVNQGLPVAFNQALSAAKAAGHKFVLFLDHDSILQPGAVTELLSEFDRLNETVPLGALEAYNEEPLELPTDDFLDGYYRRRGFTAGEKAVDDFLATNSGLFVPIAVVDRTGGFDETYFLDAADFEFGLRLRSRGLRVLRVPSARVRHQRGESPVGPGRVLGWGVRRIAPERHYYVARDTLRTFLRYGRSYPLVALVLLSMPLREMLLVILFYRNRRAHLYNLWLGIFHALRGIRGPLFPGNA